LRWIHLEGYIQVFTEKVFDTGAHRDIHLHERIVLPCRIFGKAFSFRMQRLQIDPVLGSVGIIIRSLGIEMEEPQSQYAIRTEPGRNIFRIVLQEYGRIEFRHHRSFPDRGTEVQVTGETGFFIAALSFDKAIIAFDTSIIKGEAEAQPLGWESSYESARSITW